MKWNPHYFIKGHFILPEADVIEFFKAWIDSKSQKRRFDFYDGDLY